MRAIFKTAFHFLLVFAALTMFTSCRSKIKPQKQYLTDNIYYIETPADLTLGEVERMDATFNKLQRNQMGNLSSFMHNPEGLLWLKIKFKVNEELSHRDLGLYIGHLQSSAKLFLNGQTIKKYGDVPPMENSSGYVVQYYNFPDALINYQEENTIYIQVWTGARGSISKDIYLSDQDSIVRRAELKTFLNSRFEITFVAVSLIIGILYLVLYHIMKLYKENRTYLFYSLLNLFTAFFLLAFCFGDLSWIKVPGLSYLMILKLTWCLGGITTIYFAASFTISYLDYLPTTKEVFTRFLMYMVTILIAFLLPNYTLFVKFTPFIIIFSLLHFTYVIPRVVKSFIDKRTRKKVISLLSGFSPVIIALCFDLIFRIIMQIPDLPYFCLYGWQVTIYIFLYHLLREFSNIYIHNTKLKDKLQEFNLNLEEEVNLRTKELSQTNYILSKGLETVSHVQKNFLPPSKADFKGWELAIYYRPLDNNVSGDLYDYYTCKNNSLLDGLGLFDVSGHGISAGLMTILSKGIISQQFISGVKQHQSMSKILEEINQNYIKEKVDIENYITGLLFHFKKFDKNDSCPIELANAGHPYPILYCAKNNQISELKPEDYNRQYGIIGVEGLEVSFPPVNFTMSQDDILVCYTDGLTEACNAENEEFSKEQIKEIIKENKNLCAKELLDTIIGSLKDFLGEEKPGDDITVIVLKRNNSKDYIPEI